MPKPINKEVVPFRMGDQVNVRKGTFKGLNIIHTAEFGDSDSSPFEYSSHRGAWIKHKDCDPVPVTPSCAHTLEQLRQALQEEEDGESEEI